MAYSSSQLTVPQGFPELLQGLAREVLRHQPSDIITFACEHFNRLASERKSHQELEKAISIENETTTLKPDKNIIIPESIQQEQQTEPENTNQVEQEEAALKIQSGFRGTKARQEVKELKVEKEKQTNAATVIQSGFRGMQARNEVENLKSDTDQNNSNEIENEPEKKNEEEEELPELDTFNDADVAKITKLQAGFRGSLQRKKNQSTVSSTSETEVAETNVTEPTLDIVSEEKPTEAEDLSSFTAEEVAAVTKIQAQTRGMLVRKNTRKNLDEDVELEEDPEQIKIPETPKPADD